MKRLGDDRLVVADLDGRVVGLAQLHVSAALEYNGNVGKLAALVVDAEHRGSGIGRALVEAIEADARARGCALLFVTTAERRADARAFYRQIGLEETGKRFARSLGEQDPVPRPGADLSA